MVLRHSLRYLLARGIPAVINFSALLLFTRLLPPMAFGQYALVIAGVNLAQATMFWWLQLSLVRFVSGAAESRASLLAALAAGYAASVLATVPLGVLLLFLPGLDLPTELVLAGCALLWTQSWHDLNLELARSELAHWRYGLLLTARSVLMISVGAGLTSLGLGPMGVLLGAVVGSLLPSLAVLGKHWGAARTAPVQRETLQMLLRYGIPLMGTSALMLVVNSSDRFFLGWLGDPGAVGIYAAGYDLAQFSLGTLLNVVYLAVFPLALRALEAEGPAAAREALAAGFITLLTIGLPAAAGLVVLAEPIARDMFGPGFGDAGRIIPWIAAAALIGGMKSYYFDLSFQLAQATRVQLWIAGATALANITLNLLLIPRWGTLGAAYATVAAYSVGMLLSAVYGRRVFRLPLPRRDALKVMVATGLMVVVLAVPAEARGVPALAGRVMIGLVVYLIGLTLLDVLGVRRLVLNRLT